MTGLIPVPGIGSCGTVARRLEPELAEDAVKARQFLATSETHSWPCSTRCELRVRPFPSSLLIEVKPGLA